MDETPTCNQSNTNAVTIISPSIVSNY